MEQFIVAELVENEPGAQYQGGIYDRNLVIKHASGLSLRVFDHEKLSSELTTGNEYELVLKPLIFKSCITSTEHIITDERIWTGKIVSVNWKVDESDYCLPAPKVTLKEWILVSTSLGHAVLSPREFTKFNPISRVGDWIRWEFLRLDLIAVV